VLRLCVQAATIGSLLQFAQSSAASNPDPSVRSSLAGPLSSDFLSAATTATANLNSVTDTATDAVGVEKTAYYAQAVVRERFFFCPKFYRGVLGVFTLNLVADAATNAASVEKTACYAQAVVRTRSLNS
jgi:hypothetical protein